MEELGFSPKDACDVACVLVGVGQPAEGRDMLVGFPDSCSRTENCARMTFMVGERLNPDPYYGDEREAGNSSGPPRPQSTSDGHNELNDPVVHRDVQHIGKITA